MSVLRVLGTGDVLLEGSDCVLVRSAVSECSPDAFAVRAATARANILPLGIAAVPRVGGLVVIRFRPLCPLPLDAAAVLRVVGLDAILYLSKRGRIIRKGRICNRTCFGFRLQCQLEPKCYKYSWVLLSG